MDIELLSIDLSHHLRDSFSAALPHNHTSSPVFVAAASIRPKNVAFSFERVINR